jgi:hypothetical protein
MVYPAHTPEGVFDRIQVAASGCWEWTGRRNWQGYGRYEIKNRVYAAHRVAWSVRNGPIPAGIFVCHRCDNPPCCNPDHLFLGTPEDNIRDAYQKGRLKQLHCPTERKARGSRITSAKLTERDVQTIRARRRAGASLRELSQQFGVCDATISVVSRGLLWRHVKEDGNVCA